MVKNLPANAGDARDTASTPVSGRSVGGGNGNPRQYSCNCYHEGLPASKQGFPRHPGLLTRKRVFTHVWPAGGSKHHTTA